MALLRDVGLAALAAIALSAPSGAEALAAGMIRATCTYKGATVYREDIPGNATAERRLAIASRNPAAMCVFLKIADLPPERRAPHAGSLPDEILRGALEGGGTADESLAAALSVLSGSSDDTPSPGTPVESFSNTFSQPMVSGNAGAKRQQPLNLTIGIYRGVPMESVIAHWKAMQAGTKVLSRMTPSMSVVGDVTMLSIENVLDEDAAKLCEEAEKKGVGCIAVY